MWLVDQLLVQPGAAARADALERAAVLVNAAAHVQRLEWPPTDLDDFEAAYADQSEGVRLWLPLPAPAPVPLALVRVAWWTDWLGRRHLRLRATSRPLSVLIEAAMDCPPLCQVHPEYCGQRWERGGWRAFVVCACGVAGVPDDLGWMGECCAACHDRREAGVAVPEPVPASSAALTPERPADVLAFLPDNCTLLTASLGVPRSAALRPLIRLSDLASGSSRELPSAGWHLSGWALTAVASSPDGTTLAVEVGVGIGAFHLLPTDGGPPTEVRTGGRSRARTLAYHPDGSLLAVALQEAVYLWDLRAEARRAALLVSESVPVRCLAFSPDGSQLAIGIGREVRLWDWAAAPWPPPERLTGPFDGVRAVAFAPDGRTLAAAVEPATVGVQFWRLLDGRRKRPLKESAVALTYAPDGRTLVTLGGDGVLRLWNASQGQALAAYGWHTGGGLAVAVSPDGRRVATSGADGRVKVWPLPALLGK